MSALLLYNNNNNNKLQLLILLAKAALKVWPWICLMSFNSKWSANAWSRCKLTPSAISAAGICKEHNEQLHQPSHFSKAGLDGLHGWPAERESPCLGRKAMYNAWFDDINHNVAAHVWCKKSSPAWQDFYEKELYWVSRIHGTLLKWTGSGQCLAQKLPEKLFWVHSSPQSNAEQILLAYTLMITAEWWRWINCQSSRSDGKRN